MKLKTLLSIFLLCLSAVGQTAPNYLSTTSTANAGTITALFSGTTGVNQTAYDTSYNPRPLDCYTRVTDSTTFGGASVNNNTASGGANDRMWSLNGDYVGTTTGGQVYILNLNTSGNCAQLINTGAPGIHVSTPFGFSWVHDNVFYNIVSYSKLYKYTILTNSTTSSTMLFDFAAAGNCPGLPNPFTATDTSLLGIEQTDNRFSIVMSNAGGQDTGVWAVVYDVSLNECAVENTSTGSYWNFGACAVGSRAPGTTPTGTLQTTTTCTNGTNCSCWGGPVHDSQMSGNGLYVVESTYTNGGATPWTQGACAGNGSGPELSLWQIGTQYTQWCTQDTSGLGGLYCNGHDSEGISHMTSMESTSVNWLRPINNVITYTNYGTGPLWATHGGWPHPTGDDSYPWVFTSYGLLSTQGTSCGSGANFCPINLGNVLAASYPNASSQPYTIFGHTYSCNDGSGSEATCGGHADAYFGCQFGITSVSQDGNWALMASGMLQNLGTDSSSNPRCDVFAVHIGAGWSTIFMGGILQ